MFYEGEFIMIDFEKFTDPGSREINEDYVSSETKGTAQIFVLADGLGGHGRGEEASSFVVEELINCFRASDDFINDMGASFEYAQERLLEKQKEKSAKFEMKTTVVVLVITENEIRWGHIGDSRLYMMKKSKIKQRTIDHSVPQMLVLAKEIKEKEIRNHPDRNKLLRVMGTEWSASNYELSKVMKRKKGYSFLLCSDGFWELISEKEMEAFHKKTSTAAEWMNEMVLTVKNNGKGLNMDNFSAVSVRL